MTEWILILTLALRYDGGVSIEHIGGFGTAAQCKAAGDTWINSMSNHRYSSWHDPKAVCVQRTAPGKSDGNAT